MSWLLLGLGLLFGGILLMRWFVTAEPRALARALRWAALAVGAVVVLGFLLSGRFGLIWTAIIFLMPWLTRLPIWRRLRGGAQGPRAGGRSEVRTRFVAMQLDHDSGAMDGTVLEGPHTGRELSSLAVEQVLDVLRAAMHEDMQSVQVLEAYLDRMHGPDWRNGQEGQETRRPNPSGPMSREEAYAVLGLGPGDGPEAIKRAHRRLMQQYHPDHGGSDYLAARINEAKDVLLGR
ncbi:MAG: DnaJ domain-containing protein [Alphaproteobacteria bacterium]